MRHDKKLFQANMPAAKAWAAFLATFLVLLTLGANEPEAGPLRRQKRGWLWKQLFVPEEDPTPRVIGQLKSDSDRGEQGILYVLSGEGAGEAFEIDEYSGEIRTLKKLDREEKAFYVLRAQAINRRTREPEEPQSEFIIKVRDVNDNPPRFQNQPYLAGVPEMSPVGTSVLQVTATDADDPAFGNHAKLIYSILYGEPYFSVEPKTGIVVTSWADMDREAKEQYLVVVQVKDMLGMSGGYSATATVTVDLIDINDNGPIFQHHLYTFAVPEDASVGTTLGKVKAEDADVGVNARMRYTLEAELDQNATFAIQTDPLTQEGVILLAKPLDYESKRRYVVTVDATNEEADPRFLPVDEASDRTTVKIVVDDVDEPPVFLSPFYEWKVAENAAPGTAVGTVGARDGDQADQSVRYSFEKPNEAASLFRIDPNNGTVTVAKPLDRETRAWHNVTIVATETTQKRLWSSVVASIKVLDINDNAPQLAGGYRPYICEGAPAGELIELLSATDPDEPSEGHHFYFSMVPDNNINPNFTIRDNQDNTAGVLARRSTFSRRERIRYFLPVVVTDSGSPPLSATATLTVSVCSCQPEGRCPSGGAEALALSMGLSLQTFVALLVCLLLAADPTTSDLAALGVHGGNLVSRRPAPVATRQKAKEGPEEGRPTGVARRPATLPRGGSGTERERAGPASPAPQAAGQETRAGPSPGQPARVPTPVRPGGARGRRLQAVHPGATGGGGRRPAGAAL
ncbi:cadherin-7 isoform X2 [Stigmatopora nigra]